MTHVGIWMIKIAGYGDFEYLGTEADAETRRRQKANWEHAVGRKERRRDANEAEIAYYGKHGPESLDRMKNVLISL